MVEIEQGAAGRPSDPRPPGLAVGAGRHAGRRLWQLRWRHQQQCHWLRAPPVPPPIPIVRALRVGRPGRVLGVALPLGQRPHPDHVSTTVDGASAVASLLAQASMAARGLPFPLPPRASPQLDLPPEPCRPLPFSEVLPLRSQNRCSRRTMAASDLLGRLPKKPNNGMWAPPRNRTPSGSNMSICARFSVHAGNSGQSSVAMAGPLSPQPRM